MHMNIRGKVALVTGASKGIGRVVAEALASEGADVIINYNRDKKAADEVVDVCKSHSVKAIAIKADISNESDTTRMFSEILQVFPRLDIVVNNAGIFDENDDPNNLEAFRNIFATNFFAQIDVTTKAREMMQVGKIIFISSISAKLGNASPSAIGYASSKAALESYMKNLAKDAAPSILVNAIAPGRTLTPMWGDMTEKEKADLATGHLTGRWIEPAEVADLVVFLVKNDSICGEVLVIDGGMSLKTLE